MGMTTGNLNETPKPANDTVTITKAEYESLVENAAWLSCLEDAGVDNWSGIDFASDIARERGVFDE